MMQSLIYLKLSVAGQLTILLTRTRGSFWSIRPAPILIGAQFGAQTIATLVTVYGIFMTPIGWSFALSVWGYALFWFVVNDRVKLAAYRLFDHAGASVPTTWRKGSKRRRCRVRTWNRSGSLNQANAIPVNLVYTCRTFTNEDGCSQLATTPVTLCFPWRSQPGHPAVSSVSIGRRK